MKKQFLVFLVIFLGALGAFAQQEETPKARLFDTFGFIPCDEYLARMDAVAVEAANNPMDQIYVILYEGSEGRAVYKNNKFAGYQPFPPPRGQAKTRIDSMRAYVKARKYDAGRFVFLEGGFREKFAVEIWMVPAGAEPPKPSPTVDKMQYRKGRPTRFCLDCC